MVVPDSLKRFLLDTPRCAILFSGGTDSEVLLRTAADVLGTKNVISLTAALPFLAGFYRDSIKRVTSEIGIESIFVSVNPMNNPAFVNNTPERCYVCKREVYGKLRGKARSLGYTAVMDGTNADDLEEYRPGLEAAGEYGILHPFLETGIGKADIGRMAVAVCGTVIPSDSCLATRIVEGHPITVELIELVEKMEAPLRPSVQGRLRVRTDGNKLTVRYSEIDSDVVEKHRQELLDIADSAGLACTFLQI
ncbi:MAG: hypothetical protein KAW14_00110 [Candidatus Aegiribacteria sp.]|nr:hypothetical protein [Candidatus Aegiribacteria sp.]